MCMVTSRRMEEAEQHKNYVVVTFECFFLCGSIYIASWEDWFGLNGCRSIEDAKQEQ